MIQLERSKQTGEMNFGTLILVLMLIFIAVTVMKLWSPYFDDMAVKTALENIASETKTLTMSPKEIKNTINKRLQVSNVEILKDHEILIRRESGDTLIDITYERRVPMYANVDAVVKFSHSATIK